MIKQILVIICLFLLMCTISMADDFIIKNKAEFKKIVPPDSKVVKLADGFRFVEGPVWVKKDAGYLIFSDIPNNKLIKWNIKDGAVIFRDPSNKANGNYLDLQGRLLSCEHLARRVSITDRNGKVHTLVDKFNGKKLNSPNDLVVKSDGTIWFTDPPYGLGKKRLLKEQTANFVFRFNPATEEIKPVVDDFDMPNGLCFSPDEKKLYIADSGKPHHIRVFDVTDKGELKNSKVFCVIDIGKPDGIRCDTDGRIFSSAGDGVHIFSPDGVLIGKILVPQAPSNLCFGGKDKKTLFMTARKSLYSIILKVAGAQKP